MSDPKVKNGRMRRGRDPATKRGGTLEYIREERVPKYFDEAAIQDMEEIPISFEEPWCENIESVLSHWADEARAESAAHGKAGYRTKFKYKLMSFAVIGWASIVLVVNGLLGCDSNFISQIITLVIGAINVFLNGLSSSMNLGYTYRVHFEYEAKFSALALDIEYMLSRDRNFRMAADAFMTEIRERKKRLSEAPELPGARFFFC